MGCQVTACDGCAAVEIIIFVTVKTELLGAASADILDRVAGTVVVAHAVVLVDAVVGTVTVGCIFLYCTKLVHQFVRCDGAAAPTTTVNAAKAH